MEDKTATNYEQEYEGRFEWRKARQIDNLKELSEIAQSGGADAIKAFPNLLGVGNGDDPKAALRRSILDLWSEATECYIFGAFQSCILSCGAIVERCLKLQYQEVNGALPSGAKWTLGTCIHQCKGIVPQNTLDLAQSMLEPRNNRAHALLEHSDPGLAMMGGPERGIEIRSPRHYLIEPFRGDATKVIVITHKILKELLVPNETVQQDPCDANTSNSGVQRSAREPVLA